MSTAAAVSVMKVTGPDTHLQGIWQATRVHGGCANTLQRLAPHQCANATDDLLRRTYICQPNAVEADLPRLQCSASRHWDCRNAGRRCAGDHWQHGSKVRGNWQYFAVQTEGEAT